MQALCQIDVLISFLLLPNPTSESGHKLLSTEKNSLFCTTEGQHEREQACEKRVKYLYNIRYNLRFRFILQ